MRFASPVVVMLAAVLLCLASAGLAVVLALAQPWLGLTLIPDAAGNTVQITDADPRGPGAGLAGRLVAVGDITVDADDLIEEPDFFDSYARLLRFLDRQSALAAMLAQPAVALTVDDDQGRRTVTVRPGGARPPGDLPAVFWTQIVVGIGGLLIGAWVWSLRRDHWGPAMFALASFAMMVSAHAAAVYSARELAIDGTMFRVLSAVNHAGAVGFGAAMIAMFLSYPKMLVLPAGLLVVPAIFVPWYLADILRWVPEPGLGQQAMIATAMAGIALLVAVQWWANRRDPRARAALRWLGLSVVIGAGAFVMVIVAPVLLGDFPALKQGYAFVFFLLIHAGLALGLRRYRLFELDEWAFRILFYTAAAMLLVLVDAGLILMLHLAPDLSLGLALLAVGFAYLPLRDLLWRRTVGRRELDDDELFHQVIDVAFDASAEARAARWRDLVRRLFDPLEREPAPVAVAEPAIRGDGLELVLPATADGEALALRYPWRGRGLFGPVHLRLARQLVALLGHAAASRDAYGRGVSTERARIARDLHDDVGARLLSGMHKPDLPATRETLREAIADIRTIVAGLSGDRLPFDQLAADLRHETARRLEAAGIALDWPLPPMTDAVLDYDVARNLVSALREVVSNVIRHARATRLSVVLECRDGQVRAMFRDDGIGLDPAAPKAGNGLRNLSRRTALVGGSVSFPPAETGCAVALSIPLRATAS